MLLGIIILRFQLQVKNSTNKIKERERVLEIKSFEKLLLPPITLCSFD